MAGAVLTAHTRLVPARGRADTRAKTEPRRLPTEPSVIEPTSPYPREFEPADEGRDSMPYLEVEITAQHESLASRLGERLEARTERVLRVVKTVSRKIGVGTGTESAIQTPASKADVDTVVVDAEAETELEQSTIRVQKVLESLTEPDGPKLRPSKLMWLGVVLTPPDIGASLVIGTWLRKDFRVTSPVTKLFPRENGVLVQTANRSRYFVEHSGDTYLVRGLAPR
jgi:hypothetical protein